MAIEARRLCINGTWDSRPADTVAELLRLMDIDPTRRGTAVALNDTVVPRARWDEIQLKDGDRLEIIRAVQGG
jgi:sulfur carrier protein